MSTFYSRAPVVSRELTTFLQRVTIGEETQEATFEREVLWLREVETRLSFYHGGKQIDRSTASFCDAYGFGSSMEHTAIEMAQGRCARYSVTAESSLTVVVEARVVDQPALFSKKKPERHNRVAYRRLPSAWRLPELETETYESGDVHTWHPRLKKREAMPWTPIWSSEWTGPARLHAAEVERIKQEYGPAESAATT